SPRGPRRAGPAGVWRQIPECRQRRYAWGLTDEKGLPKQAFGFRSRLLQAMLFFQLLLDAVALELRQVVDEELAVEVVAFVLDAHRQQAFGDQLVGLAVAVQRADPNLLRAIDVLVEAGYRQTAFLVLVHLVGQGFELGVDEDPRLGLVLGQVHHHHALVNVHLGSREADAGSGIYGLEHVVDQLTNAVIDHLHRRGDGAQPRIGVFEDVENGHKRL